MLAAIASVLVADLSFLSFVAEKRRVIDGVDVMVLGSAPTMTGSTPWINGRITEVCVVRYTRRLLGSAV